MDVGKTKVTVIGGHAGHTILPLLSQVPGTTFTPEQAAAVTSHVQHGGEVVVKAKEGTGSATLSMVRSLAASCSMERRFSFTENGPFYVRLAHFTVYICFVTLPFLAAVAAFCTGLRVPVVHEPAAGCHERRT
jgi:hypothetical protein